MREAEPRFSVLSSEMEEEATITWSLGGRYLERVEVDRSSSSII